MLLRFAVVSDSHVGPASHTREFGFREVDPPRIVAVALLVGAVRSPDSILRRSAVPFRGMGTRFEVRGIGTEPRATLSADSSGGRGGKVDSLVRPRICRESGW